MHADLDCSDCHVERLFSPGATPASGVAEASCARCHAEAATAHADSVHARMPDGGRAATCLDCHGAHDVYADDDPRSRTHKRSIAATCGRCHANPELGRALGMKPSEAAAQYAESIHGRALLRGGLKVAPSCVDCHSAHRIRSPRARSSPVHPGNVVATCGACHEGISRSLASSVHALPAGDAVGPVLSCVTCHSAHAIQPPRTEFKLQTDRRCGACHQSELTTHLATYHGRAHALGGGDVAACYDCHGHHEIRPSSASLSTVSAENKLGTCRKCHTDAPAHLVQYQAHADRRDRARYPTLYFAHAGMTVLLVTLSAMFGVHALSWCARLGLEWARSPARFRALRRERREQNRVLGLPGLSRIDRVCYTGLLAAVVLLVVTGMPLKFPLSAWAAFTFHWLGGAAVARDLHRAGALLACGFVALHVARMLTAWWRKGGQLTAATGAASPLPGRRDLGAFLAHVKWFVGRGPEPRFGRFTYWEKLDYLAAIVVLAVLVATGLVLWFPELTVRLLPGFVLNVAQLVHSDEALLAVASALTYHVLHVFVLSRFGEPARQLDPEAPVTEERAP